jgi:ubiquinone/menaquinone biosynthesis C-methylase UbiE
LPTETERARRIWDRAAPRYDRGMGLMERLLLGDGRRWVCSRAAGDVLEVAVGTGRNFPHYPRGVRLTAVDLSPAMLEVARERAGSLGIEVRLVEADAEDLPFSEGSFDTVVSTLALCSVPDDRRAISEMKRVLRPGGRLILLDHVRSTSRTVRVLQWLLEPLSVRFGGDHLLRRPFEHVVAEGFEVEEHERSKAGLIERVAARKPL